MEATLRIRDVGGLKGLHEYGLRRGKVNYVKAPNAAGKTSLIRALMAVLSLPAEGMSTTMNSEAVSLGIKSNETSPHEGFVNIRSDVATVELITEEGSKGYSVTSNGTIKSLPDGDEKFLIAGVLTSGSRIARQLVAGDDDFSWAIDELSYAARYSEAKELAQSLMENATREKERIGKDIQRLYELDKDLQLLTDREEDHEKKVKEEEKKIKLDETRGAREGLRKAITKYHEEIEKLEGEVAPVKRYANELKETLSKTSKKITEKDNEYKSIDLSKLEKEAEDLQRTTDNQISQLKSERESLQGTLNLFQMALSTLINAKKSSVTCPLCDEGHINKNKVEEIVEETAKRISTTNERIRKLNEKLLQMQSTLDKQKNLKTLLKEELENLRRQEHGIKVQWENEQDKINQQDEFIRQKQEKISELESKLRSITSQIRVEDKKIKVVLDEVEEDLAKIRLEKTKIRRERGLLEKKKIGQEEVDPRLAEAIYKKWISYLNTIIDYCKKGVEENRESAKEMFNKNIDKLMEELGFTDFGRIWLTRDNRLMVEREGRRPQPIRTLSTAERSIIGTLLQITLKKTYLTNVPFFVLDDVVMSFDESRKKKIFDYLEKEAKENNWFILVTKLDEKLTAIKIETAR